MLSTQMLRICFVFYTDNGSSLSLSESVGQYSTGLRTRVGGGQLRENSRSGGQHHQKVGFPFTTGKLKYAFRTDLPTFALF